MTRRVEIPGASHLVLAQGVRHLAPEEAVLTAMLKGWETQQISRLLSAKTIAPRLKLIGRFVDFTNAYPWEWQPTDLEQFTTHLRSGPKPISYSTARNYQNILGLFCDYLTDPRYGWGAECDDRFGTAPVQICHEWNTVEHRADFEGDPSRRAATYDEVQALFDAADQRAELIRAGRKKGLLAALRDAAMIKTVYAFGLRRREACMLDLSDLRRNPKVPQYGRYGALFVRWGKGVAGSPPRRRTVLLVPEFDWATDVLQFWHETGRPAFEPGNHPGLWVTERKGRVQLPRFDVTFNEIRDLAGVDPAITLHCLRHSYVTHLLEFGYPELFVQQQVGHSYAATTAIYSSVSDDYRNQLLTASVERQLGGRFGSEEDR